jgi:uncharacterized protein YjbI with pentapeptide repeats
MDAQFIRTRMNELKAPRVMFLSARFEQADLSGATLTNAVFQKAVVCDSKFERADLSMSIWNKSCLGGASFAGSDMRYSRFDHARGEHVDFSNAVLDHSRFHNTGFASVSTRGASRRRVIGTDAAQLAAEQRTLDQE